ncbi:response regulator transcription factor [Pseudoxanthomonas dokdonensis]|uniref:Two-component response regulator n=1 Tax=Pseudoxanthomonas dokdonensis TaxID=344882 RepID=A0A0R0CYF6_9GAMM|nr:response regulator transcription factor [Pseudoxanthomonas dokdonensis]KRG70152.1 two-component response regulator [Pseudoxanthomonas dokdonensis]
MNPSADPGEDNLRVALLEDDLLLRDRVLLPGLRNYGFVVDGMEFAAELWEALPRRGYRIVVLDVGLPDADGFSVARQLRGMDPGMGIIMLTARDQVPDQVRGLSQGADAYLTKPVQVELLAANLHSLARRISHAAASDGNGQWQLDANDWCLRSPQRHSVPLTRTERKVMARMLATPGVSVSREELVAELTDDVHDFDMHRLESIFYRLRRKVEATCGEALPITAVHGEGYVMTPAVH